MSLENDDNPFLVYRARLDSYHAAMAKGWSDADFVSLVKRLDAAVAEVDGIGFEVTPLQLTPGLAAEIELPTDKLVVKDETGSVGGSHKARHLFGVMLHLSIKGLSGRKELAIASCGNAAVAAAVVAAAEKQPLRVFIPTWAETSVVRILEALDARIEVCERRPGETGDPTYLRFREAVEGGAIPFSVQGNVTETTLDGGRTIGWELADQLRTVGGDHRRVRLFVQIGGGALASAAWRGLIGGNARRDAPELVLHAVQGEACAPLVRAWDLLTVDAAERDELVLPHDRPGRARALVRRPLVERILAAATNRPDRFMWPWEVVGSSIASGILDDVAYDWLTVVGPMFESGGWPVVVPEKMIERAHRAAHMATDIPVSATGAAGLAGLLDPDTSGEIDPDDTVVVLFTGVDR